MERTGGEAGIQVCQALHGEASFGVRESARTTRNGVDFRNTVDTRCGRRFARSGNRSVDGVSVGPNEAKGPDCRTIRKGDRKAPSQCESTKVGSDSRSAPIDQ